jgi:hypothetical protein
MVRNQLDLFSAGMICEAKQRFHLSFVALARMISVRWLEPAIHLDRRLLTVMPALASLATVEVRMLRKPNS